MRRLLGLSLALALPVGLACSDDGGTDSISTADWIEQADEICAVNDAEIAALDEPRVDVSSGDLDDDQLAEVADFLEARGALQQDTIDQLEELPPPDEDEDEAEIDAVLGAVRQALDDEASAIQAARDGDIREFRQQLRSAAGEYEEASGGAADFGLEECGQSDDEAVDDDNAGRGDDTDRDDNTGRSRRRRDAEPSAVPTSALDSFAATNEVEIAFESAGVTLVADATYVDGDQDCTVRGEVGGLTFEDRTVVVGDDAYVDSDGETSTTDPDDRDVRDNLQNCPSDPDFWSDFPRDLGRGNPAELDGVPAQRFDLTDDRNVEGPEGLRVAAFDVWVAEDGGYIVGVDARFTGGARACKRLLPERLGRREPCAFGLRVRVTDPEDPSLAVELPPG